MARSSPTGFAFSMLIEIAAVVMIVSLLPRFDLRPRSAAGQSPHLLEHQNPVAPSANPTAVMSDSRLIPDASAVDLPWRSAPPLLPASQTSLTVHEVEDRLDRASQQLVSTLGTAASDFAQSVAHSASRPTSPDVVAIPQPPPQQPSVISQPPQFHPVPASGGVSAAAHRPWRNY